VLTFETDERETVLISLLTYRSLSACLVFVLPASVPHHV
jgi:hypothetical protein